MSDRFHLDDLTASADGAAWRPFLERPSMRLGIYRVSGDDSDTHRPHEMDEVYQVLSGRGTLRVEGEDRPVGPGELHFVAAGERHHFHGVREPLVMLVFFAHVPGGTP